MLLCTIHALTNKVAKEVIGDYHSGTEKAASGIVGGALPGEGPVGALQKSQHFHQHIRGAGVEDCAVCTCHHVPVQPRDHLSFW